MASHAAEAGTAARPGEDRLCDLPILSGTILGLAPAFALPSVRGAALVEGLVARLRQALAR